MAGGELLAEVLVAGRVGDELEVQARPLRVAVHVADEVLRGGVRLVAGLAGAGQQAVDPLQLGAELLVHHDQEELLLVLEVRVEGALGVAGVLRDVVDRGAFEPVTAEQLRRGPQQRRPRLLLLLAAGLRLHPTSTSASWRGVSVIARR